MPDISVDTETFRRLARPPLALNLSCPRCKCKAVHRSHRRGIDWLISFTGLRPARCYTCEKRFYVRQLPIKG